MVRANNVICNTTYPVYVRFSGDNKAPKVGLGAYHCAATGQQTVSFDIALSLGCVEQKRTRIIDTRVTARRRLDMTEEFQFHTSISSLTRSLRLFLTLEQPILSPIHLRTCLFSRNGTLLSNKDECV